MLKKKFSTRCCDAARALVGIWCGIISGNMKVSFQELADRYGFGGEGLPAVHLAHHLPDDSHPRWPQAHLNLTSYLNRIHFEFVLRAAIFAFYEMSWFSNSSASARSPAFLAALTVEKNCEDCAIALE
jgi:hypothetical protein